LAKRIIKHADARVAVAISRLTIAAALVAGIVIRITRYCSGIIANFSAAAILIVRARIIRANAAADVSARIRYGNQPFEKAVHGALDDVKRLGGNGGMIAVSATGQLAWGFNSSGLKRGLADWQGRFEVATFL